MAGGTLDTRFCIFRAHVNSVSLKVELGWQVSIGRLVSRLTSPQDQVPLALTICDPVTVLESRDGSRRTEHIHVCEFLKQPSCWITRHYQDFLTVTGVESLVTPELETRRHYLGHAWLKAFGQLRFDSSASGRKKSISCRSWAYNVQQTEQHNGSDLLDFTTYWSSWPAIP